MNVLIKENVIIDLNVSYIIQHKFYSYNKFSNYFMNSDCLCTSSVKIRPLQLSFLKRPQIADYDLRTPLHIACAAGDIAAVKTLCWNNANINAIDRYFKLLVSTKIVTKNILFVHLSEFYWRYLCLRYSVLFQKSAPKFPCFWLGYQPQTSLTPRFGHSPLLEACKSKHDDVCEFLLDQGARLCLPHEMQVSELCWAVFSNDFDMIQRLVKAGMCQRFP